MHVVRYVQEYLNMFELDERFKVVKFKRDYYYLFSQFEHPIFYPEKDKRYFIRVLPELVRIEKTNTDTYHYIRMLVKENNIKKWYLLKIAQSDRAFFYLIKNLKRYVFDFELTMKSTHNGKSSKLQIIPILKSVTNSAFQEKKSEEVFNKEKQTDSTNIADEKTDTSSTEEKLEEESLRDEFL